MNTGDLMGPALSGSGYVGVLNFHGILLGIEHATGSTNPWSGRKTIASYGEIPGTLGNDGDAVDFLLGHDWDTDRAYVVQQRVPPEQDIGGENNAGNGGPAQYDEDKVVLGASSEAEARKLYEDYYHGSGREIGDIIEMTLGELTERIQCPDRQGFSIFKGQPATGGPIVASFAARLVRSQGPPPGFAPIPGGRHGGYRKPTAAGYEYWYPSAEAPTRPTNKTQAIAMMIGALKAAGLPIYKPKTAREPVRHGVAVDLYGPGNREFGILTSGPDGPALMEHAREVIGRLGWTRETYAEPRAQAFRVTLAPAVQKSAGPPPGFTPIPGGSHGGYRRRKARGWEYWYPDEHKETDHPDWEVIPGMTGIAALKPGQFAQVLGQGSKLFRWTPEHEGELPSGQTWMQDLETGESVAVLSNRVQPVRGKAKPPPKTAKPQAGPKRPPGPAAAPRGDNPPGPKVGERPAPSPTSETPSADSPKVPSFGASVAKQGTILHKIENGAYGVLRYRDAAGRTQVGMYVPREDQKAFLAEMRGLTHAAVGIVAKNYRIREKGDGGGISPEYQDLYAAAQLGLVQACRAYKGKVSFAAHAHRYMRTYAAMEARDSLGRGVPVPSRIRRLTEGYLAAVNRAQVEFETDAPNDDQVARAWHVTKKHVFTRDLGRYVTGSGDNATVVDQSGEQLPLEDWQVKGPTGKPMGKLFPGKLQLVDELRKFTAGDRTEGSEWMEDMQVASVLPRYAAATMPVGTALHLRQEVDGILSQMEPSLAQALTLRWGLDDQEPLELSELATAMKLAEGGSKKAGISAAEKLLNRAKEAFQKLASERKAEAGSYVDGWSTGSPGEQVVVERPDPGAKSYAALSEAFKGAEDDPDAVAERVRIYTTLAAEGGGQAAETALTREARGEASEAERDELRARFGEARDRQRLRAFHLQTRTMPIDPSVVRDPNLGTSPDSVSLYADEVLHGYMQAVARRGMPGFEAASTPGSRPSRVWSDERLARYLGIPVERMKGEAAGPAGPEGG